MGFVRRITDWFLCVLHDAMFGAVERRDERARREAPAEADDCQCPACMLRRALEGKAAQDGAHLQRVVMQSLTTPFVRVVQAPDVRITLTPAEGQKKPEKPN